MKRLLLFTLLFMATSLAGCGFYVDPDAGYTSCTGGQSYCTPICNTYCDAYYCWDECADECWYEEQVCYETVPAYDEGAHSSVVVEEEEEVVVECTGEDCHVCFNDKDCPDQQTCVNNICEEKSKKRKGSAGLCQSCDSTLDCYEAGARCVQINYNRTTHNGDHICTRPCETDAQCPTAFECVAIETEGQETSQCIPRATGSNHVRTCTAPSELECIVSGDCDSGQSCVRNKCVADHSPSDPDTPRSCTGESDCQSGEACVDARCVEKPKACRINSDCDSNLCQNQLCVPRCNAHSDCGMSQACFDNVCVDIQCRKTSDCSQGHTCVNAECKKTCQTDNDCNDQGTCTAHHYCSL